MTENIGSQIRDRLVNRGQELFQAKKIENDFTEVPEANRLLNDLERYPHLFVLACIMDRQYDARKAWLIPYLIGKNLADFSMDEFAKLSLQDIEQYMSSPTPLHWLTKKMSEYFFLGIQRIKNTYYSDASLIWKGKPASAEVVYRFLEFDGVGPKIASMAANALAREFKVPFADYYSIDISADSHVKRVFARLGFCPKEPTVEQVVYKARALYPEFPGILDMSCWKIGKTWCHPGKPDCGNCFMNDICPTALEIQDMRH